MNKKVVVTGFGAVTPLGNDVETTWANLIAGKSGIRPVTLFDASLLPTRVAGELQDFDPNNYIDKKEVKRMDRVTHMTMAASKMAIKDSGLDLDSEDLERIGVYLGTGIGGINTFADQFTVMREKGINRISPFAVPMMIANMPAGHVSIAFGVKGPSLTCITACASGANAIGEALRMLQRGDVDVMIAGGSEAAVEQFSYAGFCALKAMTNRNDDPSKASCPFDIKRDGFILSEGSGMVILETEEHALNRKARIYCELAGYGASSDAHHITAPAPGGEGAARAMRLALKDAEISPDAVGYINAHGTSTQLNDKYETEAIKTVFGDYAHKVPVSSTKSMTGHMLGAAGAVECIFISKTLVEGVIPPTINYEDPDPELDLDYVPNQFRKTDASVAISNSLGFGGHNACLVVRKY